MKKASFTSFLELLKAVTGFVVTEIWAFLCTSLYFSALHKELNED